MTSLQLLFIVVSFSFLLFSFHIYRKKRIGSLTFLFFFIGALLVGILSLREEWLQMIGITFGLKRGADLFVYASVMILFYLVLGLFARLSAQNQKQTDVIRAISLDKAL